MRNRERTPFAERLRLARKHAGLTQPQLAKAVGMAQSSLAELETSGNGSSKTTQLAQRCGVRAEWLAEGVGEMLDTTPRLSAESLSVARAIDELPQEERKRVLLLCNELLKLARESATSAVTETQPEPRNVKAA